MNVVESGGSSIVFSSRAAPCRREQVELLEDHHLADALRSGPATRSRTISSAWSRRDRGADAADLADVGMLAAQDQSGVASVGIVAAGQQRAANARAACSFVDPAGPTKR